MSDPMKPSKGPRKSVAAWVLEWVIVAGLAATVVIGVVWLAKAVLWS